jgi:hypothetical protein
VCVSGHEEWFGWLAGAAGWMHLNGPAPEGVLIGHADRVHQHDLDLLLSQFPTSVRLSYGAAKGGPTARDPGKVAERVVAMFQFSEKGFGFGEITIMQTKEGCFIDTEHMSRETVKRFLGALVDGAVTDTDDDPEKHLLYNQEAGRRCGAHCRICYPEGES